MADLNRRSEVNADSRGQLFLIGAIALAVAFVALTMLLNTAIYTENLSARGDTVGGIDIQRAAMDITTHTERSIEYVNYRMDSGSDPMGDLETIVEDGWGPLVAERYAASGVIVGVDLDTAASTTGESAGRLERREFAADEPENDDGNRVKELFKAQRNHTSLNDFRVNVDPTSVPSDGAFIIRAADTELQVQADEPDTERMIVSGADSECPVSAADSSGELITIDIVNHTVNGAHCDAVEAVYAEIDEGDTGRATVEFENPNPGAVGTWMVTLDPHPSGQFSVNSKEAVLTAEVKYTYSDGQNTTEGTIRVSPGRRNP